MIAPAVRITGAWVVTTALIVLGVDAAVERVASDVAIERPAPMTQSQVDEQLRERHGHVPATVPTTPPSAPATSVPATPASPPSSTPPPPMRGDQPDGEHGPDQTSGPGEGHQPPSTTPGGDVGQDGSQRP